MTDRHRTLHALALLAAAAIWAAPVPAAAQRAVPRGGSPSTSQGGDGRREPSGGGSNQGGSSTQGGGRSEPRSAGTSRDPQQASPAPARQRGDRPGIGQAVPRESAPRPPRARQPIRVYTYPWGYGGIGFYGGYYGGYYDPWWYDPWWYGPGTRAIRAITRRMPTAPFGST